MSNIPAARKILNEVLEETPWAHILLKHKIRKALSLMVKEPPVYKRAPVSSKIVTAQMAADIRAMKELHPEMPLREIAEKFGVDMGRVSEALHRKR